MVAEELQKAITLDGYLVIRNVFSHLEVANLISILERIDSVDSIRKRGGIFAIRNLLDAVPEINKLAQSDVVTDLVKPILGDKFFAVRGILFDKIPDANWKVPWHQDVTIAVQERIEVAGFGPWSTKANVLHVQPPAHILDKMVSVRIHLDDCFAENGALRVIPGSHRQGRISEGEISTIRNQFTEQVCSVNLGGVLLMRPLLLHASSASLVPGHRRVIHLDFASIPLPSGLRWLSENTAHLETIK